MATNRMKIHGARFTDFRFVKNSFTGNSLSAGGDTSFFINPDGKAWGWGDGHKGQLAQNDGTDESCYSIMTPLYGDHTWSKIFTTTYFNTYGIDTDGVAWAWGIRAGLGDGITSASDCNAYITTPREIYGSHSFVQITENANEGNYGILGLDTDGKLWRWGNDTSGSTNTPKEIWPTKRFKSVAGRWMSHVLAIDTDDVTWAWGYNTDGQLGIGGLTNTWTPAKVCGDHTFCSVAVTAYIVNWEDILGSGDYAYDHTTDGSSLALDKTGKAWSWGNNDYDQSGRGPAGYTNTPAAVCCDHIFRNIYGLETGWIALDYSGQTWGWGLSWDGEVGDGTAGRDCNVQYPSTACGNHTFYEINGGVRHTIGIDINSNLWAWGEGRRGKLGNNDTVNQSVPIAVCNV